MHILLGVLKPAIWETDVHLSQLPQSLSEMRLINIKCPLMPDWLSAMSQNQPEQQTEALRFNFDRDSNIFLKSFRSSFCQVTTELEDDYDRR
jgi:hypothetical protein